MTKAYAKPIHQEQHYKIAYYGVPMVGKTANFRYLTQIWGEQHCLLTRLASEFIRGLWLNGYGEEGEPARRFHLWTLPGVYLYKYSLLQSLWGADEIVFVIDSQIRRWKEQLKLFKGLRLHLKAIGRELDSIPLVIQYNKRDMPQVIPVKVLDKLFQVQHLPRIEAVATEGIGVEATFNAIREAILAQTE